MEKQPFLCDKCGSTAEYVTHCQSFVCTNNQCRKHFWHQGAERELCKHCGYSKTFPCPCGGTFDWSYYCGAYVCDRCNAHQNHEKGGRLAQCSTCGWNCQCGSAEDDIGTATFTDDHWEVDY